MSRRSGRGFTKKDQILEKLALGRDGAVQLTREASISSMEYRSAGHVMDAIDDLAEKLTGDRSHFHGKPAKRPPRDGRG